MSVLIWLDSLYERMMRVWCDVNLNMFLYCCSVPSVASSEGGTPGAVVGVLSSPAQRPHSLHVSSGHLPLPLQTLTHAQPPGAMASSFESIGTCSLDAERTASDISGQWTHLISSLSINPSVSFVPSMPMFACDVGNQLYTYKLTQWSHSPQHNIDCLFSIPLTWRTHGPNLTIF